LVLSDFDAFGCLRSLRARVALDGVSWVWSGSVEIAVGTLAPRQNSSGGKERLGSITKAGNRDIQADIELTPDRL
jgi:hypothetical protein